MVYDTHMVIIWTYRKQKYYIITKFTYYYYVKINNYITQCARFR